MLLAAWAYWENQWLLFHKVIFDGVNKLMFVAPSTTEINVQVDLYSDSKEWLQLFHNAAFLPPIRAVGGDSLPDGNPLGSTFFVTNGWRIVLDHGVTFVGNIYSDDYPSPFIVLEGVQLATQKVSNLVDVVKTLDITGVPTAEEVAVATRLEMDTNSLVRKILTNLQDENDDSTEVTIYDDDNVTVLGVWTWAEGTKTRGKFA